MPVSCFSSTGRLCFEPAAATGTPVVFTGPATPSPPDETIDPPATIATRDAPAVLILLSVFGLLQAAVLTPPLLLADLFLR